MSENDIIKIFTVKINHTMSLEELKYLIRKFSQFKGYTINIEFTGNAMPEMKIKIPIPPPQHLRQLARSILK